MSRLPEGIRFRVDKKVFLIIYIISNYALSMQARENVFHGNFMLAWENDMFFRTDYYYSNGFQFDYFHEKIKHSPVNYILFPVREKPGSNTYYGLQLRQEIYTPKNLGADSVSSGDHPYSATLTVKEVKITNLPAIGIRLTSSLRLGMIGPASLGVYTQELAHNISNPSRPPQGWENQVKNDIIINYDFDIEKRLVEKNLLIMGLSGDLRLGTLHTDVEVGLWFRLDKRGGYFIRLGPSVEKGFNIILHGSATARYVFYDATLQGGVFNKTSPYSIPSENITRLLGNLSLSLIFELWEHQLSTYSHFISPRFVSSSSHAWMGIAYRYWF